MSQAIDKFLNWLKDVLPTAYGVGMMVYNYMVKRINQLQVMVDKKELERKKLENQDVIDEKYKNMSDSDVILDAIGKSSNNAKPDSPEGNDSDPKTTE